jgi:hypothetical protein
MISDVAASNAVKHVTINQILALGAGGGAFSMADIAPDHHWNAANTTNSGGFASVLLDQGSGGKNLTQATGSLQAALGTDGNGNVYLQPDGTDDYYDAAAAADWKFLHDDTSAYTIGGVWHINNALTAARVFMDTCDGSSANVGASIFTTYASASSYGGVDYFTVKSGGVLIGVDSKPLVQSGLVSWAVRYNGNINATRYATGAFGVELWIAGRMTAYAPNGSGASSSNPTGPLRLFRRITSSAALFNGRLYQLWIKKGVLPDRKLTDWFRWTNTTYGSAG